MNEIMTFFHEEFGEIRTAVLDNNKVYFCGKDIATALGYRDTVNALKLHCKEDGVVIYHLIDSLGRRQSAKFISEGNLYRLITHSKLESAERFESWVFDDVLPSIRQTGGYVSNADKFVETYLPFADEPTKNLFKIQFEYINQLNDRIRRDEPKVKFSDHVSDTAGLIDMNSMAKLCADHGIRIGRNRLFRWLRTNGILMAGNLPYQEFIDRGYFRVKESVFEYCGEPRIRQQTLVTGKGQQYVLARLMREFLTEGC